VPMRVGGRLEAFDTDFLKKIYGEKSVFWAIGKSRIFLIWGVAVTRRETLEETEKKGEGWS